MQLIISKREVSKGDIVEIRATGTPFAGLEPESFVMVEIPDVTMAIYEQYSQAWNRILDYQVISQDTALDKFRIKVFSTTSSLSNLGIITKDEVEAFLLKWNATVVSFGVNEVIFDFSVYGGVSSPAFWETPVQNIIFSEVSYDSITGTHRISADYSALLNSPTYVERYIASNQCTAISHQNKVIVFDALRSNVLTKFKEGVNQKSNKMIAKRRYYFDLAVIDYIVAQGGVITATVATVATYIKDKLAL